MIWVLYSKRNINILHIYHIDVCPSNDESDWCKECIQSTLHDLENWNDFLSCLGKWGLLQETENTCRGPLSQLHSDINLCGIGPSTEAQWSLKRVKRITILPSQNTDQLTSEEHSFWRLFGKIKLHHPWVHSFSPFSFHWQKVNGWGHWPRHSFTVWGVFYLRKRFGRG